MGNQTLIEANGRQVSREPLRRMARLVLWTGFISSVLTFTSFWISRDTLFRFPRPVLHLQSPSQEKIVVRWKNSLLEKRNQADQLVRETVKNIRSIPQSPYILGGGKESPLYFMNSSCARFPTIHDIQFSSTDWQVI